MSTPAGSSRTGQGNDDDAFQQLGSSLARFSVPQDAALRVLKGSLGVSAASSVGGMTFGVLKAQPAVLYGVTAGIWTFAYTFPMFALREYFVKPILDQAQGERPASLHTHNLLASFISAGVGGVAMRTYFRGRGNLIAGALSFGTSGALYQLAGNELRFLRIKLFLRQLEDSDDEEAPPSLTLKGAFDSPYKNDWNHDLAVVPSPSSRVGSVSEESSALRKGELRRSPDSNAPTESIEALQAASSWVDRTWKTIASYSPIKPLSDEEYEKRLLQQREAKVEQLRTIEQLIAEERDEQRTV